MNIKKRILQGGNPTRWPTIAVGVLPQWLGLARAL